MSKFSIHFDIRQMLPVIREAFDSKSLQMFSAVDEGGNNRKCLYDGPCAIGVCVPEPLRPLLDSGILTGKDYAAYSLFRRGAFTCEDSQQEDIEALQEFHDIASSNRGNVNFDLYRENFETLLASLERKYLREGAEL